MRKVPLPPDRYLSTVKKRQEEELRAFAIAVIALFCSGCGSDREEERTADTTPNQSYGERVDALPDPARRAVLLRAIRDAGLDCQQVGAAERAGRYRGLPVWRATCRGGSVWTIVIAESGTAQILNSAEARLVTDEPREASQQPAR